MVQPDEIRKRLAKDRKDLLDLGLRNRLLNTPRRRTRSKSVEVVDELSEEVFRLLVRDRKALSFLPGRKSEADDEIDGDESTQLYLLQPDDNDFAENGLAARLIALGRVFHFACVSV